MTDLKLDRRAARSRALLLDALVSLMMERGYERLTIQNLLDRARVGRATFYAHFQSKEDLLAQSIGGLRQFLTAQWQNTAAPPASDDEQLGFVRLFFLHLESHRRIYHATIGRESEWTVEQHMQRMLRELIRDDLTRDRAWRSRSATLDLAVRYAVGTLWAVVIWWMEHPQPPTADAVYQIFRQTTMPGLDALLANPVTGSRRTRSA